MARKLCSLLVVALVATALPWGPAQARKKKPGEPDRVTVQHLLIAFGRTMGGETKIDRSRKEAQALAQELLDRAKAGEDFDALVKEHTDDAYPGIYRIVNYGVEKSRDEKERDDLVPFFSDVSFELEVGEFGIARYHAANSPYGFHVIHRLE